MSSVLGSVPKESTKALLDYYTIVHATNGNEDALNAVVQFFSSTIQNKAMRPFIDNKGRQGFYVDPFVKGHIESCLMEAILKFSVEE